MPQNNVTHILGVPFSRQTETELLGCIQHAKGEKALRIYTPNTEMLLHAASDPCFMEILRGADVLIPDGYGVFLASRMLGASLPYRLSGIDFAYEILKLCAQTGRRVYLLGGKEPIADIAAQKLMQAIPGLCICGTHHGYFSESEEEQILCEIQSASPQILFVCLGSPKQEEWIHKHADKLPCLEAVAGLGGSLDVWSGTRRRAPAWMRRAGLEWFWRSVSKPKRWVILYRIPKFLHKVQRQKKQQSKITAQAKP